MFAPANQSAFTLTLDGVPSELKVLEFSGAEAISQPYRFDLELVSEQPDLDLEGLLHRQAFLGFDAVGQGVHGQVYRVAQGDSGRRLTRYQISLVPQLAYLEHSTHQRIFQHKSVPQIIALVLEQQGIQGDAFEFRLGSVYPEREYCVQFGESDLGFVQRLCAELGIHYHFQHSPEGHLLVFGDDQTVFPQLGPPTHYAPGSGMVADTPVIKRFTVRLETRATAVNLRDYDFRKPRLALESAVIGEQLPSLEEQRYPGHFTDRPHGKHLAQRALERHRSDYRQAHGSGDQTMLVSGHFLTLAGHPRQEWNDLWLVTQVNHRGRQPQVLEESCTDVASDGFQGYSNTFIATPWDILFRPALPQPRTPISGYQNAVVTGPVDSEIHCDEYGRVKVQLAWDRLGKYSEHSSCWLRVTSGWAHEHYGASMIPRVGMEVLVGFVNGDADLPVVVGCLANASTPVALDLPADKTRSILRSQSSPGGGGYNELRIEDRKDAEEIYLRAQRDWTQHVLHDQRLHIGNVRRLEVGGEEQHITHGNHSLRGGQQISFSAGQQVVVEAGTGVTLQAGGHWINICADGIFCSTPLQIGGAATAVSSPSLSGGLETLLAPLSAAQIFSLKRSAPFCEECERCKAGVCFTPQHSGALLAGGLL